MQFRDRVEAGRQLAVRLKRYANQSGVVYALPRGGLPLAVEIARALNMDIDLVIPRKIGHPENPEYAIAAVGETGEPVVNPAAVARVDDKWFRQELGRQREESKRRRKAYLGDTPTVPVTGKVAIVVDDGIATGLTMKAAIQDVKARGPAKLIVAVPVVPADTARELAAGIDALVALDIAEHYRGSVGAYYENFDQLSDLDVRNLLGAD